MIIIFLYYTATLAICSISYQYLRDAINAAFNATSILIGAGTNNFLNYTTCLPQNANNSYCSTQAPSLTRIDTGAMDQGFVIPTNWTIQNLNLRFSFPEAIDDEFNLQGSNYNSTVNNLAGLSLRTVAFQSNRVDNESNGT